MKVILNPKNFTYIKKENNGYTVYCDVNSMTDEEGIEYINAEAISFPYKPYNNEIKNAIVNYYNSKISNKLVNGFVWNGMNIPLSEHDQMNYKNACDLAVQSNGASLPVTFKFESNGSAVYYAFATVDEIVEFWTAASKYINNCLVEGWKLKESIKLENYKL